MKTTFKKGFEINGFTYGWKGNTLYRLPIFKSGRNYPLKEISLKPFGTRKNLYYRVAGVPKTPLQVREMTKNIKLFKYCDEI